MKFWTWWAASSLWALFFGWMAYGRFQYAWNAEGSMFDLLTVSEKLQAVLAGTGALTIAVVPLWLTSLVYRFHKSRERHRLEKERARIEKRLGKLDRAQGVITPAPRGGQSASAAAAAPLEAPEPAAAPRD